MTAHTKEIALPPGEGWVDSGVVNAVQVELQSSGPCRFWVGPESPPEEALGFPLHAQSPSWSGELGESRLFLLNPTGATQNLAAMWWET